MSNTLHIVSGFSAAGILKLFFTKSDIYEKALTFVDPLKYAPLFRDFSDKELIRRKQFLKEIFGVDDDFDPYINLRDFVNHNFEKYERVVIWHGNGVNELLLLYMACSLIKGDLYEVDITEIRDFLPHLPRNPFIISLDCCSVENVAFLYRTIKLISPKSKQEYVSFWNKWAKSEAPLRIIDNDNKIKEVSEDYFDEIILSKCTVEFRGAARVIGDVLCDINFLAGDSFLHRRINCMIIQKKLAVCKNEKFAAQIEESNLMDKNKIVIDQVNVTHLRFFLIKLKS